MDRKHECTMFSCEAKGKCLFPDNCDERGFITRRRDMTYEEQQEARNKMLRELDLD